MQINLAEELCGWSSECVFQFFSLSESALLAKCVYTYKELGSGVFFGLYLTEYTFFLIDFMCRNEMQVMKWKCI